MAKDTYIRFRISNIKKDKLQAIADRNGESMTYILEKLIDKYIEGNENNERLIIVEQSTKSAHKRIDNMQKGDDENA